MSVLENDVKGLLLSLVDQARPLGAEDQALLATWASMKAILFDTLLPSPSVPRGFGYDLRIDRIPHRGIYVWIGAYGDVSGNLQAIPWLILAEKSDDVIAVCFTFTVLRIVFQVLIPFTESNLSPSIETFNDSVKMIFPTPTPDFIWPPPYCFDDESIQALAKRVYDNREPVVMNVNMKVSRTIGMPDRG